MPDYQKSKIYKLWSPSKNLVYYGSTIQELSQRFNEHISRYKRYTEDNNYCGCVTSFLVLECEDYKMELMEEYPCNNKQQLLKREGEYIKNNECVNKNIVGRTPKEYREDNADKYKERHIQYYKDNVDKYKEQQKQYYKDNADKINERIKQHRLKKKLTQTEEEDDE